MSFGEEDEVNPFSREHISREPAPVDEPAPLRDIEPVERERVVRSRQPPTGNPWLKLGVGCAVAMLGFAVLCCGVALFFGYSLMQEPVAGATEAIAADERITAKLGNPIESTSTKNVDVSRDADGGTATVNFNIKGPDGVAEVKGKMKYFADEWVPDGLTVTCADGTEFTLPATIEIDVGENH